VMARWTQPQHQPDPARTARQAAEAIAGRPDWWLEARRVKRGMRRAMLHDPGAAGLWRGARREFRRLATRRELDRLRGVAVAGHRAVTLTVGASTFVGCSCAQGYWMSSGQGTAAALALLHTAGTGNR
jgi:hypothetical protein